MPTDSAGPPRVEVKPAGSRRPPLAVTSRSFTEEAANVRRVLSLDFLPRKIYLRTLQTFETCMLGILHRPTGNMLSPGPASEYPRVSVQYAGDECCPGVACHEAPSVPPLPQFLCRSLGDRPYGLYMEDDAFLPEDELVAEGICSDAVNCSIGVAAPGPGAHAVRLSCQTERPPPPQLRLVGGDERSGLLELQPPLRGWGRVCATTFSAAQAEVGGATGQGQSRAGQSR